jgi:AcrR family transcriptional regulator
VGRRPQPAIKQRLLDRCTDHALEHGLPDRLEPLATAVGTSARMLVYHFGTRDALLRAVLEHARQRQLDTFGDLLRARPGQPYTTTLAEAWTAMTGPAGQPFLRMFGQWRDSAARQLWPDLRRAATTDWLGPLEDGLRTIGRPELATLVLAVIRGLLMDLDATGDTARTDRAFRDLLGTLDHEQAGGTEPARPVRQLRLVVEAEDFEEAVPFYRDVLGLPEVASFEAEHDARVCILDAGRATLELANPAQRRMIDQVEVGHPTTGRIRVAFEVTDAEERTGQLVEHGARLVARPTETPWQSLNARLDAPAGLHVTVFQELTSLDERERMAGSGTDGAS